MGPIPSPTTKSDSPRVATVREQLYAAIIWGYVDEYIDDVHVLAPDVSIVDRSSLSLSSSQEVPSNAFRYGFVIYATRFR
jgi:hypothetical protein